MAESCFSNLVDMVVGKSEFLLFSQVCNELGLQNDMEWMVNAMSDMEPVLLKAEEEQAYTPEFRSWCLNLKTHLYDAEDMLDNLHTLRDLVTQAQVGESGEVVGTLLRRLDDPASCSGTKRVDLEQGTRPGQSGILGISFLLKVMMCCGFLFGFLVLVLDMI